MGGLAQLLKELDAYCDLRARLELVPSTARMRGVYFRAIDEALESRGLLARYRELFPERQASVLWYPAHDFLLQLAVGAALIAGPAQVHQGMFDIGRGNARVFAASVLGQLLVRKLSRDPRDLLAQGIIGHRQGCNQGTWTLSFPGHHTACMQMSDEFNYIESYLLGAAQGTFDAIEVPVTLSVELEGPFEGRHLLRW